MQIVCPSCTTAYYVQPATLGPTVRSVRCVRCRTVWFAALSREPVETAVAVEDDQAVTDKPAADENSIDWSWPPVPTREFKMEYGDRVIGQLEPGTEGRTKLGMTLWDCRAQYRLPNGQLKWRFWLHPDGAGR